MLEDGSYDAIVVDAEDLPAGGVTVHLAIAAGDRKGEIVEITATGLDRNPLDLLAVPATISVWNGEPRLTLEG